jgi:signal peptidase I
MEWRPVPWIAALLGFLLTPLGMLYVQRPRLAIVYFLFSLVVGVAAFLSTWAFGSDRVSVTLALAGWTVSIACAVHAFRVARRTSSTTERAWYSRWYGLISVPLVLFVLVFLFRSFVYEPFRIPSESMHPTIPAGSIVIVQKSGFGNYGTFGIRLRHGQMSETIARGEIVVHRLVEEPGTNYISRIIGIPGDHIEYLGRQLTINGTQVPIQVGKTEGWYQYAVERLDNRDVTIAFIPERPSKDLDQIVPPGHYVVFGDNRDNTRDSRYIGPVPQQNIIGRMTKILPPDGWRRR